MAELASELGQSLRHCVGAVGLDAHHIGMRTEKLKQATHLLAAPTGAQIVEQANAQGLSPSGWDWVS